MDAAYQVSSAVSEIHSHSWIHFDLKPENILIHSIKNPPNSPPNKLPQLIFYVCDFGLTYLKPNLKGNDCKRGTKRYISPEMGSLQTQKQNSNCVKV